MKHQKFLLNMSYHYNNSCTQNPIKDLTCGPIAQTRGSHYLHLQHDQIQHCQHCNGLLNYLTELGKRLPSFELCFNDNTFEQELLATENESPNIDLLTCSSALTSQNITFGRNTARNKLEPNTSSWSCTGRQNSAIGLGPLASLFNGLPNKFSQISFKNAKPTLAQTEMFYSATDQNTIKPNVSTFNKRSLEQQDFSIFQCDSCTQHTDTIKCTKLNNLEATRTFHPLKNKYSDKCTLSNDQEFQEMMTNSWETEYSNYNPSEFNMASAFEFPSASIQSSIYSQEESYNQINENMSKCDEYIVDSYLPNQYMLNQTGAYY